LWLYTQRTENKVSDRHLYITLIVALNTTAELWKQLKDPSTDERKERMWNIHTMEYYSVLKRNFRHVLQYK
jgi:hypothetical protein